MNTDQLADAAGRFGTRFSRGFDGADVSANEHRPYRVKIRDPSFVNLQATAPMVEGSLVAGFSGFQPKAFFEAAPDAATVPKVKF